MEAIKKLQDTLNLTLVELKQTMDIYEVDSAKPLNLTLVELKLDITRFSIFSTFSLNLTLVELKPNARQYLYVREYHS